MDLKTRDFGVVHVDDDAIYEFPEGIYGFEDSKQFAIFEKKFDDDVSFLYLQSTSDVDPCFLVFEPWNICPGYDPLVSTDDLKACDVSEPDYLIFLVIATVPNNIEDLSLNIKSPVVLNPKTRKAKQVILENPEYAIHHRPFILGKEWTDNKC